MRIWPQLWFRPVDLSIEVDSELLTQAQEVLAEQGLTLAEAMELFFRHCVEHGFPFSEEEIRLC